MRAGDLKHLVYFFKRKQEQDAYGATDYAEQECKWWKPSCEDKYVRLRAALDFTLGSSAIGAEKRIQPNSCTMTIRRNAAYSIDTDDFVYIPLMGSYYRIVSLIPDGKMWIVIELEKEV
jgi:Phage head-tail joining protein